LFIVLSRLGIALMSSDPEQTRLARKLGTGDAVVMGLGSMIGAGVFAALGPAAQAAGAGLLWGLALAGGVAYCNATSSAQLAARYPESGGTYVYGRERLGPLWGYLAGWGFVTGKLASCAAMALTFGWYVAPRAARPLAVVAVIALVVVNLLGVQKTVRTTKALVAVVLATLVAIVAAALTGATAPPDLLDTTPRGVLQAAGILFFAFAGYARIATLGEEVIDPARTIPRAIPLALVITLGIYGLVAVSALLTVGPDALAGATAPLLRAVEAGQLAVVVPLVRVGAAVASLGVLLSLLVGVSRTAFAMAANGDLPGALAGVHPRSKVPHRAEIAAGTLVALAAATLDLRTAIGFSSVTVLTYYAITNAAAATLAADERCWPRWLAGAGMLGCLVLAVNLPATSVVAGAAVLAAGAAIYAMRS
jgi:basic amino acid/polyamine antiporter, APA family